MTELVQYNVGSQRWQASLARSKWKGPLPTTVHARESEYILLWWGPRIMTHPGDELVLLPTPAGLLVDEVRPSV